MGDSDYGNSPALFRHGHRVNQTADTDIRHENLKMSNTLTLSV